jgi:hypothetical protein
MEMQQTWLARAVPIAAGVVVLLAGTFQIHRVEGAAPCPLPGGICAGRCAAH